jgi:subtilisin family serine protease
LIIVRDVTVTDAATGQVIVSGRLDWNWINPLQVSDGPFYIQDVYGHGTFVAAMAAGNGRNSIAQNADYSGMAPNADILDIKVLGNNGSGKLLDVLAGIDFAIRNRTKYNIRIINLSLGTVPLESYRRDPLCRMAEAAIKEGIVVVAAAGNFGKEISGHPLFKNIWTSIIHRLNPSAIQGSEREKKSQNSPRLACALVICFLAWDTSLKCKSSNAPTIPANITSSARLPWRKPWKWKRARRSSGLSRTKPR